MVSPRLLMYVLFCGIFASLFLSKIATLIETSPEVSGSLPDRISPLSSLTVQERLAGWDKPDLEDALDNTEDDLMWFMQISDLHISIFQDPKRIEQLRLFVNESVPVIEPELVLASGDLTDAKNSNSIGSAQYEEEWKIYKDILVGGNVFNNSFWLDLRGNHDLFDVPSVDSRRNWFREYGVQGSAHPRSYLYTARRGRRRYAFVAMDATLDPGPRRPFNFFGVVRPSELAALREYARVARQADHAIWFGHYPTSVLVPSAEVRQLMTGALAYLCGHLHTMAGLVPHMYTRQRVGTLELELGDWKDNRRYRLLAIDRGLLSFTDVDSGDQWPLVLVTSPKRAQLTMARNEPLWMMRESPHIRVLAFSVHAVSSVRVQPSDGDAWVPCTRAKGPLFTCDWQPAKYAHGLHTMQVLVEDSGGLSRRISHTFSLDGSEVKFPLVARLILMLDGSATSQLLFAAALLVCALPPGALRLLHAQVTAGRRQLPRLGWRPLRRWLRRLTLFASVDRLYWPHVGMLLYLPVGPWLAGELITGQMGVVFAWGSLVGGAFLPGLLQYVYGMVQLLLFHLPLMLATGCLLDCRLDSFWRPERFSRRRLWTAHAALLIICLIQLANVYLFYLSYDLMATLLGPFRTWALLVGLQMWYSAATLPKASLRRAAAIWLTEPVERTATD
ncbi:transmembrane protein 62-like [Pollicipes pollicipes]|uniref:transmembrane protein 62-like n=1 Tax=Pollicipes pollicipes TaxID=41117 RepID=UPI0018856A47|nr:transmembrane protein 62-like [Pollicipes pollicipes]